MPMPDAAEPDKINVRNVASGEKQSYLTAGLTSAVR